MFDGVREFVAERIVPLEGLLLACDYDALVGAIEPLRVEVKARGWWAPQVGQAHGGMGLDLVSHGRMGEVLGWSPLGHYVFGTQAPDAGNIEVLAEFGSDAQKARWLDALVAGEIRSCFGMTEPEHAGSNPTVMSTRARLEDGEWIIDGHKWFTTAADGAALCIVMAMTEGEDVPRHGRASMIIVPTDAEGFVHERRIPIMGEEGAGFFSHSEIRLTSCRVPAENLLGERGTGFAIAQQRLGPGRIHHCMRWIGIAERAFDMMCQRASTREIAPGKVLGSKQTIQNWIAESRVEIDAARMMVLDTAGRIDRNGVYESRNQISAIKFYVAGILQRVVDRALQVHGALGMTDDTVLSWFFRHERAARIYDGPDEVHKAVVARRVLRGYGVRV